MFVNRLGVYFAWRGAGVGSDLKSGGRSPYGGWDGGIFFQKVVVVTKSHHGLGWVFFFHIDIAMDTKTFLFERFSHALTEMKHLTEIYQTVPCPSITSAHLLFSFYFQKGAFAPNDGIQAKRHIHEYSKKWTRGTRQLRVSIPIKAFDLAWLPN